MIKNLLKPLLKESQIFCGKVIANGKGMNQFCKESQLVYELTHTVV